MFNFSTRCSLIRDPEDPLSTSTLREKDELRGKVIRVCRSSCFSPVPRTHGVGLWRSVVRQGFEVVEGYGIMGFVQLEVIGRSMGYIGGSVVPTDPRGENPSPPPPSPPPQKLSGAR